MAGAAPARARSGALAVGLGAIAALCVLWVLDCGGPGPRWARRLAARDLDWAARPLARALAAAEPECFAAREAEAALAYRARDFEAAEPAARRALALRPDDPDTLHMLGNIYLFLVRYPEAADAFGREVELVGEERALPGVLNLYGLASYKAGRLEAARAALERVTRERPDYFWSWLNLSLVYAREGLAEDAERTLARAREVDPSAGVTSYAAGAMACMRGDAEACFAGVREAVRRGYRSWHFIEKDPDTAPARALPAFGPWLEEARRGARPGDAWAPAG